MKKNLSDITIVHNNKYKKVFNKEKINQNKTTQINTSLEQSQINSQNVKEKENQKKFIYLNQRVQIPTIYYERVEYVKKLLENEDLGFIIANAPLFKSTRTKELGKYFKEKLKNIVEIANGIIFYLYKTFTINKNIFEKSKKNSSSKVLTEIILNNTKSPDEILQSGEINSSEESVNLYREICGYAGVKIEIISGLIKKKN